ncbi:hypothetical protein BJ993_002099 [Nocardioides aromaticivorans]|uniref:Uncharacterized protein n=1 Tax=Nocardioides aromaticivorans TaxID=200618 RepID=A0A7Y9ZGI1_9ACTN|nr:hypothetical protein [Nocardioides aromaticivorans]NYI45019.1 hypothetical protein [Nocardioides aromaticivorans]
MIGRTSVRAVAPSGALLSAIAILWFSRVGEETSYGTHLAPAMFLLAVGFGFGVMALTQAAVYDVPEDRAGVAAAVLNAAQQVGVGLGLALLAGVAAAATGGSGQGAAALVDGYQRALEVATVILLLAGVVTALLLRGRAQPAR